MTEKESGFGNWPLTVLVLAALLALTVVGLTRLPAGSKAAAQVGPQNVALSSGLEKASAVHTDLVGAAHQLQPPTAMPVAERAQGGNSSGAVQAVAAVPSLPPVPPEQRVTIALTGSVIAETDPCG